MFILIFLNLGIQAFDGLLRSYKLSFKLIILESQCFDLIIGFEPDLLNVLENNLQLSIRNIGPIV